MKKTTTTTKEKITALFNATKDFNYTDYLPVLLNNNSKLGKNVFDFNLIPVVSCGGKQCTGCYDINTVVKYGYSLNNTYRARLINTLYALHNVELLKECLISKIRYLNTIYKNLIIRIHTGGDFITVPYMNMWYQIIKELSDIKFYFYTKEFKKLELFDFYNLKNCKAFLSVEIIDGKIIIPPKTLQKHYNVAWINYNFNGTDYFSCPGDCTACGNFCADNSKNIDVLFTAHGNGKKQIDKITNKYNELIKAGLNYEL